MNAIIRTEKISKRFSGNRILANNNVDMELREGEVHAVAGENGSGKSTIMHIVSGLVKPDSGKLFFKNRETVFKSPAEALASGIGMIHQIPCIINSFSSLDNIILGSEEHQLRKLDRKTRICEIESIKENFGIDIDLLKKPSSPRERQYTLLLALIYQNMDIIVFDEPTSAFTDIETGFFFNTINKLRDNGKTIVFITHKIKAALSVADRITVFSKGENRGTFAVKETELDKIASLIIGGRTEQDAENAEQIRAKRFERKPCEPVSAPIAPESAPDHPSAGKIILEVAGADFASRGKSEGNAGREISFKVKKGEIFSFTGIRDNNLDLLEDMLGGFLLPGKGKIMFEDSDITGFSIGELRKKGIIYIPSDRIGRGTSMMTTVENNIALTHIDDVSDMGFISQTKLKAFFHSGKNKFSINALYGQPLWQLSGGNIQKIILYRELYKANKLLIICEPAWNLDLKSRNMVYDELFRLKEKGTSIIIISTDIDEVVDLSDRAAVMYKGRIAGIFEKPAINSLDLGRMMLGLYEAEENRNCQL